MRILCVALLLPIAASCAKYPASPVPGVLSDRQAVLLADAHLNEREIPARTPILVEPQRWGWLVMHHTHFNPVEMPPIQSHLVAVNHDGSVRTWTFEEGD